MKPNANKESSVEDMRFNLKSKLALKCKFLLKEKTREIENKKSLEFYSLSLMYYILTSFESDNLKENSFDQAQLKELWIEGIEEDKILEKIDNKTQMLEKADRVVKFLINKSLLFKENNRWKIDLISVYFRCNGKMEL